MIIVYHQASGFIDSTNLFGHVAIAFTGLGAKSFGISWMGADEGFPTYHNYAGLRGKCVSNWQDALENRKKERAFPQTREKIEIKSVESGNSGHTDPMSEKAAYDWWKALVKQATTRSDGMDFRSVPNWGGKDCADVVFAALKAAGSEKIASARTITRPVFTPPAAVQYAKSLQEKSE
ncbi:hypothetical protein [Roseibium sp.]|uniref:hypothetical protein n=1 Tax=Roseibium sp. TaxID=1936156 RepID=UPI003D0E4A2F